MANFLSSTGEALLRFPEADLYVYVQEGSGDNLLREDVADGYVDYIDWTSHKAVRFCGDYPDMDEEVDGGMAMFREYVTDLSDDVLVEALKYEAGLSPDAAYKVIELA